MISSYPLCGQITRRKAQKSIAQLSFNVPINMYQASSHIDAIFRSVLFIMMITRL